MQVIFNNYYAFSSLNLFKNKMLLAKYCEEISQSSMTSHFLCMHEHYCVVQVFAFEALDLQANQCLHVNYFIFKRLSNNLKFSVHR